MWTQTASGQAFDLLDPKAEQVHFKTDIAEPLARQARFNGQIAAGAYSVAQHCVMGADALLQQSGSGTELAAAFLLHDAHEAILGDITTPVSEVLAYRFDARLDARGAVHSLRMMWQSVLDEQKAAVDRAIYARAGVAVPTGAAMAAVKTMDIRMLRTERDHLLGDSPMPWGGTIEQAKPIPLKARFTIWPWPKAADEWLLRLRKWCPDAVLS